MVVSTLNLLASLWEQGDSLEKKSLVEEEEEGYRNKFEIPCLLLLLFLHPRVTNLTKPQK